MSDDTIERFWQSYLDSLPAASPHRQQAHITDHFGDSPELADELGALILAGTKTATCSSLWEWEAEGGWLPQAGLLTIVLDGRDQPICIIETMEVVIQPFNQVDEAFAAAEGEGDRTLQYWREAHWRYFSRTLPEIGRDPTEEMLLVCERFQVVYPLPVRAQSYDYATRQGVEEISWERFAQLGSSLAERLSGHGIEMILGIARAGLFPATLAACALRCEFFPVRVSRRENDQVLHKRPVWKVDVPVDVAGSRVAVVDEIADTGETLALVAERARQLGAAQVTTACLVSHTWAQPRPDLSALVTDALVIFPWDRRVYIDDRWQLHPELAEALRLQGIEL